MATERTGAEELRLIVENMNITREDFNDRFTAEQLVQIGRMLLASEWDIYPDQWSDRQVREALAGKPPRFDARERPVYHDNSTRIQCFCGNVADRVVPWPELCGVMVIGLDGKPHCSAFEGEFPRQYTTAGAAAVQAQIDMTTRELAGRYYAVRRAYKRRRKWAHDAPAGIALQAFMTQHYEATI